MFGDLIAEARKNWVDWLDIEIFVILELFVVRYRFWFRLRVTWICWADGESLRTRQSMALVEDRWLSCFDPQYQSCFVESLLRFHFYPFREGLNRHETSFKTRLCRKSLFGLSYRWPISHFLLNLFCQSDVDVPLYIKSLSTWNWGSDRKGWFDIKSHGRRYWEHGEERPCRDAARSDWCSSVLYSSLTSMQTGNIQYRPGERSHRQKLSLTKGHKNLWDLNQLIWYFVFLIEYYALVHLRTACQQNGLALVQWNGGLSVDSFSGVVTESVDWLLQTV